MNETITDDAPPPPWAHWKAADRDGETFYYSDRPRLGDRIWHRTAGKARLAGITNVHVLDWRQSLTQLHTDNLRENFPEGMKGEAIPISPPTIATIPPFSNTFHEGVTPMSVVRDSNGRFAPGNPGGPGRKPREIEQEYLAVMEQCVSGEAWQAIVNRATTDAIGGDAKARTWLSAYLLGQPISRAEVAEEHGLERILSMLDRQQDEA